MRLLFFVVTIMWWSLQLNAELFDPFSLDSIQKFLGFSCEIRATGKNLVIKHDCQEYYWIYGQIYHARKQRKQLNILLESLEKTVSKNSEIYRATTLKDAISISNVPLELDFLKVSTKLITPCNRIGGYFYDYECYFIEHDNQQRMFWLTIRQKEHLAKIRRKNIKKVTLNLTALKKPGVYENFFQPEEIIIPIILEING